MNTVQTRPAPFDAIAAQYDDLFTNSLIGRAQRDAVWDVTRRCLPAECSVLELNCGTGEDAFFLARCGMRVVACDISEKMIEVARSRAIREEVHTKLEFVTLATEDLPQLRPAQKFGAAFSNFSGLNCVADLNRTAADLAHLLPAGSTAILCFSNKYCLWEAGWYLLQGKLRKAFRRWTSKPVFARIGGEQVTVHYPSVASIAAEFALHFRITRIYGIGIAVPPSYLEAWVRRLPSALVACRWVDRLLSRWPAFRVLGDHVLLVMKRTAA